ncbi:MAG: hypothetical protein F6K19_33620 [Cyanothece sp. SIO1E1]|nr:hypothetical protein [Cyanothece sp. SIO1E1]
MLAEFQARYPTASLTAELLTIHDNNYVVRASIQVDGVTRATGMAAATSLEQAEDQARMRALQVLGLQPGPVIQVSTQSAPMQIPSMNSISAFDSTAKSLEPLESIAATGAGTPNQIPQEPEPMPELQPVASFPSTPTEAISTEATQPPVPLVEPWPQTAGLEPQSSIDLSDVIAQTSVELERLNWTNEQGSQYLQQTYGKRSRRQLTDEELLEFLHYLESQPLPGESIPS